MPPRKIYYSQLALDITGCLKKVANRVMMDPKNPKIEFCGATFSHGQDLEATGKQKQYPWRDSTKSGWDCQLQGMSATGDSAGELRLQEHCVTQLELYTVYYVVCLCVYQALVAPDQISTFFQYIQAYKPFTDPVLSNTKQYQFMLTKYQPVSSYTDPVPSSTTYNSSSRKRHSSANWIISLFTTHLMSHAQYTWSSSHTSLFNNS